LDANSETRVGFGRDITKDEFASALLYKLQRKKCLEPNDQSNVDSAFTENISTSLQLLVIWRFNDERITCVRTLLIKHSNTIAWDEDALDELYSMHSSLCRSDEITKDIWLLDDATVLMTTSERGMHNAFEITISEGTREDSFMEPLWVSSNM
jgi:hypothetical protein